MTYKYEQVYTNRSIKQKQYHEYNLKNLAIMFKLGIR